MFDARLQLPQSLYSGTASKEQRSTKLEKLLAHLDAGEEALRNGGFQLISHRRKDLHGIGNGHVCTS